MQTGQKVHCYLHFKHVTRYVHSLWSPLLGDQGVLGEPFVTVGLIAELTIRYFKRD